MQLGICTIQRDRGRWLTEWVTFHYLVGFRKFFIYLHKCTDNSPEIVISLKRQFDIECHIVPEETVRPQLVAYQHAYQEYGHTVDWIAFLDGDEFLFPTEEENIQGVLARFQYQKISAIGVWWSCFGSGNHIQEPDGLVIDNYQLRASHEFEANRHVKCIVRGHQGTHFSVSNNAHLFNTILGTFDEQLRPITHGFMPELEPSYKMLRINHYVCQSLEYFKKFKQNSGAADAGALAVRPDEWWVRHDRNDVTDDTITKFRPQLIELLGRQ